ncbi:NUDIX domain-containing protein [Streptomyces smyrnaeus]|uniref:NUDIX domain-containing protein n=1 Tax=Streptomyces smyrnaeus TaxID=1387713 RepID=UPI0036913ECC
MSTNHSRVGSCDSPARNPNPPAAPGGRIETRESAQEAASRELAEETGLSARLDDALSNTSRVADPAALDRTRAERSVPCGGSSPWFVHPGKAIVLISALASCRESSRVCWTTMGTSLVTRRQ